MVLGSLFLWFEIFCPHSLLRLHLSIIKYVLLNQKQMIKLSSSGESSCLSVFTAYVPVVSYQTSPFISLPPPHHFLTSFTFFPPACYHHRSITASAFRLRPFTLFHHFFQKLPLLLSVQTHLHTMESTLTKLDFSLLE